MKKYLYDERIEKIKENITIYEKFVQKENNYQLFLANGDVIKYSINKNNLAHLMGVDFTKLVNYKIMEKDESYNMLNNLVIDPYKYYRTMKDKLELEDVFSKFVDDKLDYFNVQYQVPYPNNTYFVCKYDRTRSYMTKEIDGLFADYYLARKTEQGDVVLLGLVKANEYENDNTYIPQTSRIIKNDENFQGNMEDLLSNQVVTYLNGISISNNETNYNRILNLNTIELLEKLEGINYLSNMTNSIPCTINDHIYNLKGFKKNKNTSYEAKGMLFGISEKMKSGELIELTDDEREVLDNATLKIIDIYNDGLFSTLSSNDETYTSIKNDRDEKIKEVDSLSSKIDELKGEVEVLKKAIELRDAAIAKLEDEQDKYDELKEKIKTLAKSC